MKLSLFLYTECAYHTIMELSLTYCILSLWNEDECTDTKYEIQFFFSHHRLLTS